MRDMLHRTITPIVFVLAVLGLGQVGVLPVSAQPAPCADLVITNMSVSPNPATEDVNATVSITVKNQGTCASLSFVVQWRDNAGALAQPVLGQEVVNGLNAGAQTTLNMSYIFPDPGNFTTIADVDTDRTVDETNENNNQEIFNVVVKEARPDLFVSSFTVVPSNPAAGQSTQVNIKVKNGGPVAAGPFIVQWKSNSTFLTPEGPSQQVDGLGPGATKTVSFNYIFPDPGDFQTQVNVDTDNTVVESNEDNNIQIFPVLVSESLPDLAITGFDIEPEIPAPGFPADQPVAGENAVIRLQIVNQGNVPSVSFVVQWKSDEFAPLGASSATVPGLGVGESTIVELKAVFQRAGEYETIAEIDTDRTVKESNEVNNLQIAWVRVQPRVVDVAVTKFEVVPGPEVVTSLPPDPDDNLALHPEEATKLNPVVNRLTKAKIQVKNLGNVPVNAFRVEWKPTQPGVESFDQLVNGLLPGQVSNHTFDYIYNRTGDFVSQATADVQNTVRPEANDENNVATVNVRVEAELPDLEIIKFWIMPPSPVAGTEVELVSQLYVKIRNRGNSPAGVFNVQVRPQPLANLDSQQIPGLGVHETIVVKFDHVYPRAGTFTANARVDPPIQRVEELFETNNAAQIEITVQRPTDDLDVIDIHILPNPHNELVCPEPGDGRGEVSASKFGEALLNQNEPVKVCIYIQNLGNSPMRQFMVEWNPAEGVFPPLKSEGPATIKKQVDELGAGQVALIEFDFVYERAGEFRTLTFADADNVIRETNEENNREIYNVVVNGTGPDLTILDLFIDTSNPLGQNDLLNLPISGDAIHISREHQTPKLCGRDTTPDDNSPTSVLEGRKIYACIVVKNQGNRPSGPFVVEWNPDSFGLITQSPQTVSTQVANLNAGEEILLAFGYTYPQAGEFRSVAKVDAFNDVAELQEGNNQKIRDVVSIAQGPDLTITGISIQQLGRDITVAGVEPTLIQGQPVQVSITVRNIGTLPAGPFLVEWNPAEGVFPSLNPNGPSTLEKQVNGLPAGQSIVVKFEFTYDRTGGFRTLANADSTNTVEELNEDNNMDILNVVVNPAPIDLRIVDFVVNNGSNPVRGSQVPVDVIIRNVGDYPTKSFSLQFKPLGAGGAFGPQQRIDGLQPNETRTVRFDVVYSVAGEGPQQIQSQAIIDTRDEIPETNEGNNTLTKSVTVEPRVTNMTISLQNINVQQGDDDGWIIVAGIYSPGNTCNPTFDGDTVLPEPIEDFECVLKELGDLDNGDTGTINQNFTVTLVDADPVVIGAFAVEYDVDCGFLGIGGCDVDIRQRGLAFQFWTNRDYRGVGTDSIQAVRDESECCYVLNYDITINSEPPILAQGVEEPPLTMVLPSSWFQVMPRTTDLPDGVSVALPENTPDPSAPAQDNKVFLPSVRNNR